ncbi:MAG: hypothetical protein AUJ49_11115 [Desulfovibrionaceae bacterium CG1_02_65_16]|nr:MAG: hypothetical protein AUJ49_11115 [Desulfovibrionaceae bacterium CG1_02_65_16]
MRQGFFSSAVRDKALALAGIEPGSPENARLTAADLGAGAGFVTEALLAAGVKVFAVDASPEMLEHLRGKLGGGLEAAGRLTTLVGEAERLPLPDGSVDFAFANMLLHHVQAPGAAIAEMARVLRPGGRLVLTDLDSHAHAFLLSEHHDRWPGFARADVRAWLTAAGLRDISVDCCGEDCCADSSCGADHARVSIFAASASRPVLGLRLAEVDPEAVAGYARGYWENSRPLLCAESVLAAVARGLGVRSPLIPRMATGFCSGLSRTCGPCGAFSAGVMALGLALGRDSGRDDLNETFGPVQEFREYFLERFGSLECRAIAGYDLGDVQGLAAYRENCVKTRICAPMLEQAAAQVIRILKESRP